MAAKRLTMRQLREILRLKLGCGLAQRAVATAVNAGTGTVSEYLGLARAAGVGWPIPEELASDEALEARVFGLKEIPWPKIAFSSTKEALREYISRYGQ